jgi:hypothetical protein
MAKPRMRIAVGDLFEKTNATRWAWQVREIVTPSGHRPHVRLVRFDHPSEARLFSLSALSDRRLFIPVARRGSEPTNVPSGPARVRIISNAACQDFSAKA